MIIGYLKTQKGATLVMVALFMVVLLGFVGLVVDVGNLYIERSRMQTAVDMAALAGANEFPDDGQAKKVAREIILANNEPPATIISDTTLSRLTVNLTKEVPTYIMGIFGFPKVAVTVRGVAQSAEEASKYTIYANKELKFKSAGIYGSVYSGEDIKFDPGMGNDLAIYGDADAGGEVRLSDSQVKNDDKHGSHKHPGVTKPMPTFPPTNIGGTTIEATTGTIKITKEQLAKGVKIHAAAGQEVILDLGICTNPGKIEMSGEGNFIIVGINNITPDPLNPLFIYGSGTGTVTIKADSLKVGGTIYVPKGKVIMDCGACDINDSCVVADAIEFTGAGSFNIKGPRGDSAFRRHSRLIE